MSNILFITNKLKILSFRNDDLSFFVAAPTRFIHFINQVRIIKHSFFQKIVESFHGLIYYMTIFPCLTKHLSAIVSEIFFQWVGAQMQNSTYFNKVMMSKSGQNKKGAKIKILKLFLSYVAFGICVCYFVLAQI